MTESNTPMKGVKVGYKVFHPVTNAELASGEQMTPANGETEIFIQLPISPSGDGSVPGTLNVILESDYEGHVFACPLGIPNCTPETDVRNGTKFRAALQISHEQHENTRKTFKIFDKSVWTVEGRVIYRSTKDYYKSSNMACYQPNVKICAFDKANDFPVGTCVETDDAGKFEFPLKMGTSVYFKPEFEDHTFEPDRQEVQDISANVRLPSLFENTFTNTMTLSLSGCRGKTFLGYGKFKITAPYECAMLDNWEVWAGLNTRFSVPPLNLRVELLQVDDRDTTGAQKLGHSLEIIEYVKNRNKGEAVQYLDMNSDSYLEDRLDFEFRPKLEVSVVVGNSATRRCSRTSIVDSFIPVNISFTTTEFYKNLLGSPTNQCHDTEGDFNIIDGITEKPYDCNEAGGCDVNLYKQADGTSGYILTIIPGEPNVMGGFTKSLLYTYKDPGRPNKDTEGEVKVYIDGEYFRGSEFAVTLTDATPLIVLYDPPGGMSFAELSKGTTITSSFTFETKDGWGGGLESETSAGAGLKGSTCAGLGVMKCFESEKLDARVKLKTDNSQMNNEGNSYEFEYSFELSETISTSQYPGLAGNSSDVYYRHRSEVCAIRHAQSDLSFRANRPGLRCN